MAPYDAMQELPLAGHTITRTSTHAHRDRHTYIQAHAHLHKRPLEHATHSRSCLCLPCAVVDVPANTASSSPSQSASTKTTMRTRIVRGYRAVWVRARAYGDEATDILVRETAILAVVAGSLALRTAHVPKLARKRQCPPSSPHRLSRLSSSLYTSLSLACKRIYICAIWTSCRRSSSSDIIQPRCRHTAIGQTLLMRRCCDCLRCVERKRAE